ncbi:hypothetical protein O3M35_011726 [Rhynocoris fuscipes]|uniref:Uncharacterized protein n=1 Tax=Rhynocoris fuscipes TaxID=488301 RepID=A0AAW1CZX8_9HEMI
MLFYCLILLITSVVYGNLDIMKSCIYDLKTMNDSNYRMVLAQFRKCKELGVKYSNYSANNETVAYLSRIRRNLISSNNSFQNLTKLSKNEISEITDNINNLYVEMILAGMLPQVTEKMYSLVSEYDDEFLEAITVEYDDTLNLHDEDINGIMSFPFFLTAVLMMVCLNIIMLAIIYGYLQKTINYFKHCVHNDNQSVNSYQ